MVDGINPAPKPLNNYNEGGAKAASSGGSSTAVLERPEIVSVPQPQALKMSDQNWDVNQWRGIIDVFNNPETNPNAKYDKFTDEQAAFRWKGIKRIYSPEDVKALIPRGDVEDNRYAARMARKLFLTYTGGATTDEQMKANLVDPKIKVQPFGCDDGDTAINLIEGGSKPAEYHHIITPDNTQDPYEKVNAIYGSGWMMANNANNQGKFSDLSLQSGYTPAWYMKRIKQALEARARQQQTVTAQAIKENRTPPKQYDYHIPTIVDLDAGFGSPQKVYTIARAAIKEGASAFHIEDQLASQKKCGHLGGKALEPRSNMIKKLNAIRLAFDVSGVPGVVVARTDAEKAMILDKLTDPDDYKFVKLKKYPNGQVVPQRTADDSFYKIRGGSDHVISRMKSFAPYADLLWFETSKPNIYKARKIAAAIHEEYPTKPIMYNNSPSFEWKKNFMLDEITKDLVAKQHADKVGVAATLEGQGCDNMADQLFVEKIKLFELPDGDDRAVYDDILKPLLEKASAGITKNLDLLNDSVTKEMVEAAMEDESFAKHVYKNNPKRSYETDEKYADRKIQELGAMKTYVIEHLAELNQYYKFTAYEAQAKERYAELDKARGQDYNNYKDRAETKMGEFIPELAKVGVKIPFSTLPAFHAKAHKVWKFAEGFTKPDGGMKAYSQMVQQPEADDFNNPDKPYLGYKHQTYTTLDYLEKVKSAVNGGSVATTAKGIENTEDTQFTKS